MSLRDKILQADDLPREAVDVPEWECTVYVRMMTGIERDLYESDLVAKQDQPLQERMRGIRARLVCLCTVDETGENLFTIDDVDAVGKKNATALDRIVNVASRLNALSPADVESIAGN